MERVGARNLFRFETRAPRGGLLILLPRDEERVERRRFGERRFRTPRAHGMLGGRYRGSDRTGLLCAIYRVVFEGWTKDDAMAEMFGGDFHTSRLWDWHDPQFLR